MHCTARLLHDALAQRAHMGMRGESDENRRESSAKSVRGCPGLSVQDFTPVSVLRKVLVGLTLILSSGYEGSLEAHPVSPRRWAENHSGSKDARCALEKGRPCHRKREYGCNLYSCNQPKNVSNRWHARTGDRKSMLLTSWLRIQVGCWLRATTHAPLLCGFDL